MPRLALCPSPLSIAVVLSLLLHTGLVSWWLHRPVVAPSALAMQTVTVDLLALEPPAGQIQQSLPDAPAPEAESLPEEALAEQPVVSRQQPKPPKRVKQQETLARTPVAEPAVASAAIPAATPPAPVPISAARYDADYLKNPSPVYPPLSRRLGEEGRVLLRVQVSSGGVPLAVEIHDSSGYPRLDEAARKAAQRWRFVPARQGDNTIISWVEVPIQFSLKQ